MKHSANPRATYALDAHHRVIAACTVAVLAFIGLHGQAGLPAQLILTWDAFVLTILILAWIVITTKDPYEARRNARLQDASATFIFTLVVSAATASLFAVALLLGNGKDLPTAAKAEHIALAVSAIVLSWFLVHTIFSLRYAHAYFTNAHKVGREDVAGGLVFPGHHVPDYLDFAYFSFVIGMTCQVSDVQVSSPNLRRLALIHGLISFVFNTAILAMFVNIVAGLF